MNRLMFATWVVAIVSIQPTISKADSAVENSIKLPEIKVGENEQAACCDTIKGYKCYKFKYPPKLELIDKYKAERVPWMTRKNYWSDADRAECVDFIDKLRDYRTGKRKKTSGESVTMEEWDILVEGAFVKCGC